MPLDLHVLGLSLAFILSQDQTLRCIIFFISSGLFLQALRFYALFLGLDVDFFVSYYIVYCKLFNDLFFVSPFFWSEKGFMSLFSLSWPFLRKASANVMLIYIPLQIFSKLFLKVFNKCFYYPYYQPFIKPTFLPAHQAE